MVVKLAIRHRHVYVRLNPELHGISTRAEPADGLHHARHAVDCSSGRDGNGGAVRAANAIPTRMGGGSGRVRRPSTRCESGGRVTRTLALNPKLERETAAPGAEFTTLQLTYDFTHADADV